ncbi:phosphate/phosphite/phosphonate ABC transporter substrate-binding protein [Leptothoe sp. PORK10 BA2]|uniref:phosphate/phosphite/phosphonate ABC transporter substrate-binding protein n=1 Tax=Leptothoe sp. PORK10 BA2 TaxID=3110254 RepID=UPI002B1E9940|nr:phosphate/phosphite/phosphonate ABC transporter substrate-binding protein [Leptothoe sp. PORK10 BA2]MEA5467052.1 phosphate/phosphite/phosphonate ABC transporter substrate-binding protein [Leptothoe sp. PORK10 BA2]
MCFPSFRSINLKVIPLLLTLLCTACSSNDSLLKDTDTNKASTPQTSTPQTNTLANDEPVYFGVLAIDSAVSVNEQYAPLMNYLSSEIQRPVELVILSQDSQFTQVEERKLDFITNNPLAAVQVQRLYETNFLLTHTYSKTGTKFGGLIIVDSDSKITTIEDLKGKRAACINFETAAAGCIFQIYHLLQNGFDPYKDFSSFIENKSQDNIVLAVLNGQIDAGFIRTGHLEKMVNKGSLTSSDEVRIIDVAEDDFFYSHTTELYPEWPIAALSDTDPDLAKQVQTVLGKLSPEHPALAALKVDGFDPAEDYSQLHDLIQTLKLKSWDVDNNAQ